MLVPAMSSTPAQKFVCPRCRASFDEPGQYCAACGADMTRASPLEAARASGASVGGTGGSAAGASEPERAGDRRLSDSNRTWLGKVVDGRYRVLEVIGRGGMGVVYRVEHLRMGKIAAMKVLHRDLAQDPEIVHRFEREAAAISKLHHPHTVQVFDFGTAQGALYLIMEYVRGLDLARIIGRDGPMPWPRCAPLLAQICGALQEAHELGIVHRDLKPENVLITRSTGGRDYAKVLDFGLAKLDQRGVPSRETERTAIVGTPYFMAPEQIRGDDVDARTDIYSFGALMFELLTGEHLYTGSTAVGVLTKHLTAEPDAPSMRAPKQAIPPAVDQVCRKALARDPSARWHTAAELGAAIEEIYSETVHDTNPGSRSGSRGLAGGRLVLERDDPSDLRLRRSDIDAFERSLRRRRVILLGITAAIAIGAIVAAAVLLSRAQRRRLAGHPDRAGHAGARIPRQAALGDRARSRRLPGAVAGRQPAGRDGDGERAPQHRHQPQRQRRRWPARRDRRRDRRGRRRGAAPARDRRADRRHGRRVARQGPEAPDRERQRSVHADGHRGEARGRDRAEQHGRRRQPAGAVRGAARLPRHAARRRPAALDG
jgi:serine/threonine-protein kinase